VPRRPGPTLPHTSVRSPASGPTPRQRGGPAGGVGGQGESEGRREREREGGREGESEGGRWPARSSPGARLPRFAPAAGGGGGRCSRATPVGCGLGAREARALGLERVAPRVPPPQRRCSPGGGGGRWVTRSFMLRHLRRDHRVVTVRVWDGRREPGRCGGVDPGRAGGEHHHHCHCVRRWTRRPGTRPRRYFRGAQEPCHNFMP
jgi:hypothetical protein